MRPVRTERIPLSAAAASALRDIGNPAQQEFLFAKTVRKNHLCAVADLLIRQADGWELLIDTNSLHVREAHIWEAAFTAHVFSCAGYPVRRITALLIQPEYVRGREMDWKTLYIEQDITERAFSHTGGVRTHTTAMLELLESNQAPQHDLFESCLKPRECEHWETCSAHLPQPNVFSIVGMSNRRKFQLYRKKVVRFEDCLKYAKLPRPQRMQVLFELEKRPPAVNRAALEKFLRNMWYPMAFLDFESYQPPVPPYTSMKPFSQCAFLYSVHYQADRNAQPEHRDCFVPFGTDPRRQLAEGLCRDIPANACVAVYSSGLEKAVVRALAEQFPDLREHLNAIAANMRDMLGPFRDRFYYDRRMEGSCSLKHVLPAVDSELSYHDLQGVQNGEDAMHVYERMGSMQKQQREETQQQLRAYCAMDTLALVKILCVLQQAVEK